MYDLYSEFDVEEHMKKYVNYLEVIILPTGRIEYAVPSHQEKLIKIAMEKYHISRDELMRRCPQEYYCDFMEWLQQITGCVSVWSYCYKGKPNKFQKHSLRILIKKGLTKGEI